MYNQHIGFGASSVFPYSKIWMFAVIYNERWSFDTLKSPKIRESVLFIRSFRCHMPKSGFFAIC